MSYRKHPTKEGYYQIRISQGRKGKELTISRECDEAEALLLDKQLNAACKGGQISVEPTITDTLPQYIAYYRTIATPLIVNDLASVMRRCLLPTFGRLMAKQVVRPLVHQYISQRLETTSEKTGRSITHRTVQKELNYLSHMLKWMFREGLSTVKMEIPKPVNDKCTPSRLTKPIDMEEFAGICSHIEKHKVVIFMLMAYCGLRITEASKIRVEDIDMKRRQLSVKCKGGKIKSKIIPSSKRFILELVNCIGERVEGYLVLNEKTGEPYKSFKKTIVTAAKKSGITQHVTHHNFRHAFSTELEEQDAPDSVHMALMGHSTLAANNHYRHATGAKAREYTDRIAERIDAAFDKVSQQSAKLEGLTSGRQAIAQEIGSGSPESETPRKPASHLRLVK